MLQVEGGWNEHSSCNRRSPGTDNRCCHMWHYDQDEFDQGQQARGQGTYFETGKSHPSQQISQRREKTPGTCPAQVTPNQEASQIDTVK